MIEFCVLGSGSAGNAALLMTREHHVLIDAGFRPDELARRLDGTGASWESLDAIVLTHLHEDHLKQKCLTLCAQHSIMFVCHEAHAKELEPRHALSQLRERKLLRTYNYDCFNLVESVRCTPIELPHDRHPTYGFRLEARRSDGRWASLGYAADLGEADEALAPFLADVELLALEFNHDEDLERRSGRPAYLIERVLGRHGHLSNRQAAELFERILKAGTNGGPQLLLQLHLSRECNRPELAYQAAQEVVAKTGVQTKIFSTRQDVRGTVHRI